LGFWKIFWREKDWRFPSQGPIFGFGRGLFLIGRFFPKGKGRIFLGTRWGLKFLVGDIWDRFFPIWFGPSWGNLGYFPQGCPSLLGKGEILLRGFGGVNWEALFKAF